MGGVVRRRAIGVAITGMVVAGIVGVTSMSASGQTFSQASGPALKHYGTLSIELDSASGTYLAVLARPGENDTDQIISATQPCATVDPATGTLLSLSPTPGSTTSDTVQIRNNALGVNTGNTSCGSSAAAAISGGELLKVELGSTLTGVFAKSASLNLTRVKSGNLTVGFDGGSPVAAGQTSPWSSQTVSIDDAVITTANDLFTSITIGSTSRKDNEGISLATGTSFELVTADPNFDVAVDCGEFVAVTGGAGDIATEATYERLDNKTDEFECDEVGVRVQIQEAGGGVPFDRVFWNNDVQGINGGDPQSVQAYFTIVWAGTADADDLTREIDYDGVDGDGSTSDPEEMLWCDGFTDGIPNLPPTTIDVDSDGVADDLAPWCLVQDDRELQADGTIIQTQKLFGSGDPWAR